jgi:hypothetical protein
MEDEEEVHVAHGGGGVRRRGVHGLLVGETRKKETNWET